MNRVYALLFIVVGVLFWLGWRSRQKNQMLATALFTASAVLFLILLGGFFGIIGA